MWFPETSNKERKKHRLAPERVTVLPEKKNREKTHVRWFKRKKPIAPSTQEKGSRTALAQRRKVGEGLL